VLPLSARRGPAGAGARQTRSPTPDPSPGSGATGSGALVGLAADMGVFVGRGAKGRWIPWVWVEVVRPAGRDCRSTTRRIGVLAAKKRCGIVSAEM
jgi:hypothetical protein